MRRSRSLAILWSLVLLVPLICVWLGDHVFWAVTNRPERFLESAAVTIMQSAIAALPFVFLAVTARVRLHMDTIGSNSSAFLLAALVGVLLTVGFWGLFYCDGYTYWRDEQTGGANIGLGIFMLLSPLAVGGGMFISHRAAASRRAKQGHDGVTAR
jgi:hypothetical protein